MLTLTKKQKNVFDFIEQYYLNNEIYPTIEEIKKGLKLKSNSNIWDHIKILINKGYITKTKDKIRNISIRKKIKKVLEIPILGTISAGNPIEAIENIQSSVSIVNESIKNVKDYYALKVNGNSMIEEGIFDGDIVIVKKQSVAENGQTVVAVIDDNKVTLKKYIKKKIYLDYNPEIN